MTPGWQTETMRDLASLFDGDETVLALAVIGSSANPPDLDVWSDVDTVLVIRDGEIERYYPATTWLSVLGDLYAINQSSTERWSVTRVCLRDLRRIDFIFVTETALLGPTPALGRLFQHGSRTLFSRSAAIEDALRQPFLAAPPPEVSQAQIDSMGNDFWFKGVLAATKVARDDLVIGLHLALGMMQDCCVLAMMLRDRQLGTTHHRFGSQGNEEAQRLPTAHGPYTSTAILNILEQTSTVFDALMSRWDAEHTPDRAPLLAFIAEVRRDLERRDLGPRAGI